MTLIGMEPITSMVDKVCEKAPLYRHENKLPPHMSVTLDPGCGRSSLLWYLCQRYETAGVCRFTGMDKVQEFTLDGTMGQLYSVKRDLYYSIVGREIKAFDASALKDHLQEYQTKKFLDMIQDLSKDHLLVFFWTTEYDRNMQSLRKKVISVVPDVIQVEPILYDLEQLAEIAFLMLQERGVETNLEKAELKAVIQEILLQRETQTPKDIEKLVEELVLCAEIRGGGACLTKGAILRLAEPVPTPEGKVEVIK